MLFMLPWADLDVRKSYQSGVKSLLFFSYSKKRFPSKCCFVLLDMRLAPDDVKMKKGFELYFSRQKNIIDLTNGSFFNKSKIQYFKKNS